MGFGTKKYVDFFLSLFRHISMTTRFLRENEVPGDFSLYTFNLNSCTSFSVCFLGCFFQGDQFKTRALCTRLCKIPPTITMWDLWKEVLQGNFLYKIWKLGDHSKRRHISIHTMFQYEGLQRGNSRLWYFLTFWMVWEKF